MLKVGEKLKMLSIHVKLFKPDKATENGGPDYHQNLQNSSKCIIDVSPESFLESVLIQCAEKCDVTPIYLSLFGLKDSDTGSWVNLALTVNEYVTRKTSQAEIHLEFRVRFIFTNDCPGTTGQQQHAYRESVENDRKHDVMNDTVLRYLFYQQRDDFREGQLEISEKVLDEDSANLGIAVLDMLRLACELKLDLRTVINRVSLKRLVSLTYCEWLSSRHWWRKWMIKHRFQHYVKHFEGRFRQCLDNNSTALYFHVKYLKNLEILMGSQNIEVFDVVTMTSNPEECNKISVGPYLEIVKHSKQDVNGSKWCRFADIADLKLTLKEVNGQEHWMVTLIHMSGEVLSVAMSSLSNAENLASCIDGYYHLLVDSHHYLCKQVCKPSLVKQLALSCHGPISSAYAVHVLKNLPLPQVGNCLLRCSYDKYGEYFINTIVDITHDGEVVVRNFKIDRVDGRLGVFGDGNLERQESLSELLEECENPIQNDIRLPFNVARLVYPTVAQPNALLIHRSDTPKPTPTASDMTIIPQGAYKFQQPLGGGRFTEVTLYSKRDQRSDEVVVKKVYDTDNPGQQQHIESSFEESMIKFKQLNNWMDGEGKNKNIHVVLLKGTILSNNLVLEYVPLGSIMQYAQKHREHPGTRWILSVVWQLSHACSYLEEKGCAHGNIRGKNVLLKHDGEHPFIKLSDPGVRTCQRNMNMQNVVEPTLSVPWLAYEFCKVDYMPETATPTVNGDKWSFATTVCEICYWSASRSVIPPRNAFDLSSEIKIGYRTQSAVPLPAMLLAPELYTVAKLLKNCWSIWPHKRPAFRHIMRELGAISHDFDFRDGNDPPPAVPEAQMPDLAVYDDQNLIKIQQLGRGHFGHVDLCQYDRLRNGEMERVAVKSLLRNMNNQQNRNDLYNEIQTMRQINHRYVVQLKGVTFPSVRIVMEYLSCGTLKGYLNEKRSTGVPLTSLFYTLYVFCSQIAEGMQALQEHRLIHRDLALRNILLGRDADRNLYVKISDFGLSRVLGEEESYYRGNLEQFPALWYAPECLVSDKSFRFESDVWSFGVTIWQMFSYGAAPQYANQRNVSLGQIGRLCQILMDGERLAMPTDCPPSVYEIMNQCWQYYPQDRISFDALQQHFNALAATH